MSLSPYVTLLPLSLGAGSCHTRAMSDSEFRTQVRLPRKLATAVKHAARYRGRSFNSEATLYLALGSA